MSVTITGIRTIDIRFPTVGTYMFHAHQTEFGDLGWMGFFEVTA